ncbi:hypothetical protein [Sphingomonas sp. IW22]|jgi:hypothetical protein|uniref:hypothetical protein n=1 Tax=Sphingomonas sp. IW22 TaxID=3242489 RepID=UPI003520C16F
MRDRRTQHRLALAVAAATLAGFLTAWAAPDQRSHQVMQREIAEVARDARGFLSPRSAAGLDQALPVARTIVSKSQ